MDPNTAKILFYTLLEAASRYREGYWREELLQYIEDVGAVHNHLGGNGTFSQRRKIDLKVRAIVNAHEAKLLNFNKAMYGELESVKKAYTAEGNTTLDNYATAFSLISEELDRSVKNNSSTHLLAVCKLYNDGAFTELERALVEAEAHKLNTKYQNHENTENIPLSGVSGIADAELSEEQHQASGSSEAEASNG